MVSEKIDFTGDDNYPHLPPFPTDVKTAPLLRISLGKLLANDSAEIDRLYQACVEIGFFYLYLEDSDHGKGLLDTAEGIFGIQEKLFDLDLEEKRKFDFSGEGSYFGYKAQGVSLVDNKGNLDRNEMYAISKDDILEVGDRLPAPAILSDNREILGSFIKDSHEVALVILKILNNKLGLPEGTFQSFHRPEAPSGDQIRLIKAPPQPVSDRRTALGQHSDFGSITVLFNRLGGLQILPPGAWGGDDSKWEYVQPLPNHCIINLGDALVKFTNGLLRSNIHRVTAPPGAQGDLTRYSLVYFNRPEYEVMLRRLEGTGIPPLAEGQDEEAINSRDWVHRRMLGPRVDLSKGKAIDLAKISGTEKLSERLKT